ncbi:uncharacterized protein BO87DRAFT_322786 [Aspergillus neoniger CBS 115656]|uniref:Uncharacterized protein n=1 Tax=Aspergillus neoniger (strain CBS 115656) TaxID=1448310 RepID=A0A318Y331_ASPNB|nr:hypothetical protein BO87DRAFT_322786 [Aspergillus neoniger CBS 115656]PYH28209.1 hypothetical protein BO87DRAFT_322786 [Aspergillus neoniger CBS 115656]
MYCLRHVNYYFNPKEDALYDISCLLDAKASVLCCFCSEGRKTCDPVGFAYFVLCMYDLLTPVEPVTGLLGNARDLVEIIEWAVVVLDEEHWNGDVKQTIREEVYILVKVFDSVEGAYTCEFLLKGTKTAKRVSPRYNQGVWSSWPYC